MQIHAENVHIHLPPGAGLLSMPVRGETTDRLDAKWMASHATASTPALGAVWPGEGGIYVGVLPAIGERPAQHMILSEQETKLKWGPYTDITEARSRHDGRANTAALLAAGSKDFPAAWWCADMQIGPHEDFHLPSQAELFLASLYAPQVFEKEGWYWTSTQDGRNYAFAQYFATGFSHWSGKGGEFRVRAVRWIQL